MRRPLYCSRGLALVLILGLVYHAHIVVARRRRVQVLVRPGAACDNGSVSDHSLEKPPPQFPGGPDPTQPVPRSPVDGIDLATYARIAATLIEQPDRRHAVLSELHIDELRWTEVERTWLLRVATAALQNDRSLGEELDRAYTQAQAELGPAGATRSLEEYAGYAARIESGDDVVAVLAEAKLSLGDWARLQRAWAIRLAQDPELTKIYRTLMIQIQRR
jgi:hypothetical protein